MTGPLRLTVEGVPDATLELASGWREPDVLVGPDPEVRALPVGAADRAAGLHRFEVTVDGWVFRVLVESAARAALRERASEAGGRTAGHRMESLFAQIPGRIVRLWVAEGDTVEPGQRLLAIEAMKMENEVRAPHDGTIETILVSMGGSVELGDELLRMR